MFSNFVCINTVTQKISSKHCCSFSCVILLGHNKSVLHSLNWTIELHLAEIICNKDLFCEASFHGDIYHHFFQEKYKDRVMYNYNQFKIKS